jgi:hypothetical protein
MESLLKKSPEILARLVSAHEHETYPLHLPSRDSPQHSRYRHPYDPLMAAPRARPSSISRLGTADLGMLDTLPSEILLEILEFLDFRSLSRFCCVSLKANNVVKSLLAYSEVMAHAAGPLSVLATIRLLPYHSCFSLHRALRSGRCASCSEYGGFLFLFTCERACSRCLSRNLAFHVTKKTSASFYFGFDDQQVDALPTLHSLPGLYPGGPEWIAHPWRKPIDCEELVSLKQAKLLALKLGLGFEHSSKHSWMRAFLSGNWTEFEWACGVSTPNLYEIPFELPDSHETMLLLDERRDIDSWPGVGHVRFP